MKYGKFLLKYPVYTSSFRYISGFTFITSINIYKYIYMYSIKYTDFLYVGTTYKDIHRYKTAVI